MASNKDMKKPDEAKKFSYLPDWKNFVTGGTAGAVSRTVTNPLERLKILRQLGIPEYKGLNFWKAMKHIAKTEGFVGFLKGNGANVVRVFPFTAFQFYFYELFKKLLFPNGEKNNYKMKLLCGGLSAICTSTLTYPLDLVRTFLSIQTSTNKTAVMGDKPSMIGGMVNIAKTHGFFGLYRGWLMSMIGVVPYLALQLSVFDWTATHYMPDKKSKWFDIVNLLIGGWAGFVGAGLTYPTDVMRRKMQLSGIDKTADSYTSIFDCARKMYKADGYKAFFRGFVSSQVKIVPAAAIMFMTNERLKKLLKI